MLELQIFDKKPISEAIHTDSKNPTKKKKTIFIQKHYSECVWKDKEGNISFIECPYCTLLKEYKKEIIQNR